MNVFNRFVMTIMFLVGLLLSIFFILAALDLKAAVDALTTLVRGLSDSVNLGAQVTVGTIAALVGIACFLLLLVEILPRKTKGVRLTGVTGAAAELTIEAIMNRIRYEVEGVPEVRQVRPSAQARGDAVDVTLQLYTELTTDIAVKTEEISLIVRDTVEKKLGVKLRNLRVFVRQDFNAKAAKKKAAARQQALAEIKTETPEKETALPEPPMSPLPGDN